ncbi:hypothetical protein [Variovorax sp. 160MFSha2.1]|uniref:hypothetical protein n=1 Tax=Variovorax sp. 160MFSha2.1 TaxID=3158367 RepID=UPI003AAA87E9
MTTTPTNTRSQGGASDELALVRSVLRGYPASFARSDALRAISKIESALAAPASAQEAAALLPNEEQMREGFREYDWNVYGAKNQTPWQLWRDGAFWANRFVIAAAPSAAVQQGESPSEKQQKLMELADRIDHEELWRWAGMDHHKMTPEQQDRMNAGVALRRYARLWAPGRWLIFPPVGPVNFSASTLDKVYAMAKKDEDLAALASAQPKTGEAK